MKLFKIIMCTLCIGFTFNYRVEKVNANTLNDLYLQLQSLENEVNNTTTKKVLTKSEISKKEGEVVSLKEQINKKNEELAKINDEILVLKDNIAVKYSEIKDLLLYYQLSQDKNEELSFIINGDSVVNSIHRANNVTAFTKANDTKIAQYNQMNDELTAKLDQSKEEITNLENLNHNLNTNIAQLNGNLDGLNTQELTSTEKIALLKTDISYYEGLGCSLNEELNNCVSRNFPPPPPVVPNPPPPPSIPEVTPPPPLPPSTSGFIRPITEGYVTSEWGVRLGLYGDFHTGIDLSIRGNPPIYAAASGIVASSGYATYAGYYVAINHEINGERVSTLYAHMAFQPLVSKGDSVNVNTQLGNMGTTGASTGEHLHFQMSYGWIFVDYYSMSQNTYNPRYSVSFPDTGGYFYGR